MAGTGLDNVLRHIHTLVQPSVESGDDDARRLEKYASGKDPAAFAELVRRHGPLVWRVCRRLLPQAAAAEDAFQATFLVLARKASSIRKPAALASWLHGVAFRV